MLLLLPYTASTITDYEVSVRQKVIFQFTNFLHQFLTFKAFIKPFEAPQIFSLRQGVGREGRKSNVISKLYFAFKKCRYKTAVYWQYLCPFVHS